MRIPLFPAYVGGPLRFHCHQMGLPFLRQPSRQPFELPCGFASLPRDKFAFSRRNPRFQETRKSKICASSPKYLNCLFFQILIKLLQALGRLEVSISVNDLPGCVTILPQWFIEKSDSWLRRWVLIRRKASAQPLIKADPFVLVTSDPWTARGIVDVLR